MSKFGIEQRVNRSALNVSSSGANFSNSHLFKANANVREVFIPWQKGFSLVKILKGLNPEDGGETFDPMILPDGSFGSWQTSAPVVVLGKGEQQTTFCALSDFYHPVNLNQTPYYLAYNMVSRMSKMPQNDLNRVDSWVNLLYGTGSTDPAVMQKPAEHTFVAVINLVGKNNTIERSLNQLHVLHLKRQATVALRNAVNSCMASGVDITDFRDGPLVSIWSSNVEDPWTNEPANKNARDYGWRLFDSVPNTGITKDFSAYESQVKDLLLPWSHILYCPSLEQQARWCMDVLPPSLLTQAWKDPMGSFYSFVTDAMAKQLDEGCRIEWQQESARQAEKQARMYGRYNQTSQQVPQQTTQPVPPAQPAPKPVAPRFTTGGNSTPNPVEQPPQVNMNSSIPGLIPPSPRSYSPVPEQFKNMLSDGIPFDSDDPDIEKL